jgi:hypothetical protein
MNNKIVSTSESIAKIKKLPPSGGFFILARNMKCFAAQTFSKKTCSPTAVSEKLRKGKAYLLVTA